MYHALEKRYLFHSRVNFHKIFPHGVLIQEQSGFFKKSYSPAQLLRDLTDNHNKLGEQGKKGSDFFDTFSVPMTLHFSHELGNFNGGDEVSGRGS